MTTVHETDSQVCSSCSGACRSTAVDRHGTHRPLSIDGAQSVSPLRRSTDWPSIKATMGSEPPVSATTPSTESDPHGIDQHAAGAKLDAGKPMPWLVLGSFSHALAAVVDVGTKGAIKYTPNGWAHVQDGQARYMEAFGRHMLALGRGETIDPDTGCLHRAQMIWNLLASLELELREANDWAKPGSN